MALDEVRARYLRDRVLTATPAQRVVMLYDRLGLDLNLAEAAEAAEAAAGTDAHAAATHLAHALEIVAELHASLDAGAGGPAANLSAIYTYLLGELLAVRGGQVHRLPALRTIVTTLGAAWSGAAEQLAGQAAAAPAGAWVG
ncbi:MAG: flagellar secretion chaperone FliS [Pseudonocardiales bacterium]|jgi:flagellar protein FliS|nr:flagellar secretion chaperone FliS [Pseudonocardiales bacterium]